MGHLFNIFQAWLVLVVGRLRWLPLVFVWLSSLLCAIGVAGCGSTVPESRSIPPERVFNVCWKPPELGPGVYFDFPTESGLAASTSGEEDPAHIKYVFKYSPDAPASNLRLLPLSRVDAWCPHIPQPSILEVPAFEPEPEPCPAPVSIEERLSDARLLFGQTSDVPIRSPFFCDKQPRVAYTVEELISLRTRNVAFHLGFENAYVLGKAVTIGAAESQAVINKSDSWLKRALTSDPGSLEQIQQRMADALNTIEPLPEYDDPILDGLVMAGYQAGFEQGKFEVEAKLFAIDVGVMLVEFALLEVALGPLGGARLLASAVSKGAKALTVAVKRLENIPIFIPGATNGVGGFVRIGKITTSVSAKVHRYRLRKALEKELKRKKAAGESTHHMVALEDDPAAPARAILDKFNIKIDEAVNGVFLPATKSSPNPTGAIVHATLRNGKYYDKVNNFLQGAKSQADVINRLKRIRETLLDGTFYDAIK